MANIDSDITFQKMGDRVIDIDGFDDGMMTIPDTLCVQCEATGTTRMMLTSVPFFREIIIASFECDTCHYRNSDVQFGGSIQPKGCRISLTVNTREDLNREIVKSDSASISIPELQL